MNKGITLCAALVATLALPGLSSAQEISFKKKTPAVGDSQQTTEHSTSTNNIEVSQNGKLLQKMKQTAEESKVDTITVLALDAGKITKIKVHVAKNEVKQDVGMGAQSKKNPLVGKTFLIEKTGDDIVVTDEAGKKLGDDLAKVAVIEYSDELGDFKNEFTKIIPDKSVKVGETLKVSEKVAQSFFNSKKEKNPLKVDDFTLTLKGTKNINGVDIAVFEMTVKFSGAPAPGAKIAVEMTGPLHIGIHDCYPYLMDLKGKMSIQGSQQGMDIKGVGENKLKKTGSYKSAATASKPTTGN
ncbi:MAG: hypothetical protein P1V97_29640 [Planctomycetota bacterium]|nr:hypothetical protein [Planctomycetota bacterium]